MNNEPERIREKLRQEEIKNNTTGNLNDALNRAESGHLPDATGSSSWKSTGTLIIVIIVSFIIISFVLR